MSCLLALAAHRWRLILVPAVFILLVALAVLALGPRNHDVEATGTQGIIVLPDPSHSGGAYSSLVLDSSGNPVVSHQDGNFNLKLLHCGNPSCTSGNTTTDPVPFQEGGGYSSLALDGAGNPIISHWPNGTRRDLDVVHCGNPTCSAGNTSVAVDTAGDVGRWTSLALDAAGRPVVSYFDATNADLKLVHCGNASCTSGNTIVTLDSGDVGDSGTSLKLDASGNPVVAYCVSTTSNCGQLRLVFCGDPNCSAGTVYETPDAAGDVGAQPTLQLDAAGNPVVSYIDVTNDALKVLHCGNTTCTAGNSFASPIPAGGSNSLVLDASGNPVISYYGGNIFQTVLRVLHCGDPNCTSGNSIATADALSLGGFGTSLALDGAGNPVVSYFNYGAWRLKLLHCGDPLCVKLAPIPTLTPTRTSTPTRTPLPTFVLTPNPTPTTQKPPTTLTFAGSAGGGTIRLTTTADLSGIIRVEVDDVDFPGCGTGNALRYLGPPAPLTGGTFDFSFLATGPPVFSSLHLIGGFVSQTSIAGTIIRVAFARPGPVCGPVQVTWKLAGPIDTQPGPDDIVFQGSAKTAPGTIIVTTDPSQAYVTSLTLTGLSVPPCTDGADPIDVIAFFDPPVAIDQIDGSFDTGLTIDSPPSSYSRTLLVHGTFENASAVTGLIEFFDSPFICSAQIAWNALRQGTTAPRMRKLPALQNLFLTRQGVKIPPVRCVDGTNAATLTESMNVPITSPDPKNPPQRQQLGGFSFQVKYDPLKVCVTLRPGAPWTVNPQQVCVIEDSLTAATLQGVARINCVTLGKATRVDTSTAAGRVLALIEVRPQPGAYSQIRANQGNGQVVQLNNEACKLTDLQGHAIQVFSCEDADVTIRFLEGDVEPDCQVNTLDTQAIAFRWGAFKGSTIYNDRFNLEPSGTQADQDIDVNDLQFVYGRFGSTCGVPWPAQAPVNPKA